jgi:hypothetical protein
MPTAIRGTRNAAAPPGLDVNRPPLASGFVLEMFWTHRRFSNAAENPKWNENALPESCARFGRLHTSHGRQGKSAAFGRAHVVGGDEVLRGSENDQAVAPFQIVKEISAARAVGQGKFAVKPS